MCIAKRLLRLCGLAAALLLPISSPAAEAPSGHVVLTVGGKISAADADGHYLFDMAMLESLPQHQFVTHTPWHEKAHEFSGPLLRDLLARVGASGNSIEAIALNDYKVQIPIEDTLRFDMIVARLMDGKPMSVREKGPLFILYPFDQQIEAQSQTYYNRAIWQLKAINVE